MSGHNGFFHNLDKSAVFTVIGIILLFSTAVIVTLIAPRYVDPSWTHPTNPYQVQMYEVADPNFYISGAPGNAKVYHLKERFTLLAFEESASLRIMAPKELERYITHPGEPLKLTSKLLLLRTPEAGSKMEKQAKEIEKRLQDEWTKAHPNAEKEDIAKPSYDILELYSPGTNTAFSVASTDGILENWVDTHYEILDETVGHPYHKDPGVIYVLNPVEYRVSRIQVYDKENWVYDPQGQPIGSLEELKSHPLGFLSRQELIKTGEHIYAIEGCWYCHSDQTRTLVQDLVVNGSESYPAPPSSASEYIYQDITFLSTRRIGPDLSRVGIKRPSRDWHKSHFWSPKTESKGSIMPSFRHFFDNDPRGTSKLAIGIPNYKFEAMYQYLMTKGTRITPPTQAWWLGKDPIRTKEIIEGQRKLP